MTFFTKEIEVRAEQFHGVTKDVTLVELKPLLVPKNAFCFYYHVLEMDVTVLPEDWIVEFPDSSIEVHSEIDFEARFRGHSEVASLKKIIDRMAWTLGGVSTIALGHLPDGQYEGKPIVALEEILRLRQFVDAVLLAEEKNYSTVAQIEAIEKIVKRFKDACRCSGDEG